ncbi:hypothetical protein [Streptomyces sp. NPDC097619]|uniref:hypothetical protein n=1 Tax=Streptomyces sp. NPDC097619 TaxID=3157228 RepID=UPI00331FB3B2
MPENIPPVPAEFVFTDDRGNVLLRVPAPADGAVTIGLERSDDRGPQIVSVDLYGDGSAHVGHQPDPDGDWIPLLERAGGRLPA